MGVRRVLDGVTLVVIGGILLANTTGALPWSVWWTILSLWPLLLIAAGIDILGRSLGNEWVRAIGGLVIIGGLLYGAASGSPGVPPIGYVAQGPSQPFSLSQPHDPAIRTGDANVAVGLSRFTLKAGEVLASATGETPFGQPTLTAQPSASGDSVRVEMRSSGNGGGTRIGAYPRSVFDATLDGAVEWKTLTVDAGLSDTDLDLSALVVDRMEADVGLASARVTLGRPLGTAQATIKAGMSSLVVRVPDAAGVEVDVHNGLGSTTAGPGLSMVSGSGGDSVWRSAGDAAAVSLRVTVDAGLASVRIERYAAPEGVPGSASEPTATGFGL